MLVLIQLNARLQSSLEKGKGLFAVHKGQEIPRNVSRKGKMSWYHTVSRSEPDFMLSGSSVINSSFVSLFNFLIRLFLRYRSVERGKIVWRDYTVDGEVVKSPVDLDELLIMMWQVCEYGVPSGKTCVDSNCYVLPH